MSAAPTTTEIPGYVAGTWSIDSTHTDVGFSVRHMMVSKVRGTFHGVEGTITTTDDPLASSVDVSVDLASIDTGNSQRDDHIRSADFFDSESNRTMTYRSSRVRRDGEDFILDGDLTLKGVTKPVHLKLELNGFAKDPWGGTRAGFSASGEVSRNDFGLSWNTALEGGGVLVGDRIQIQIEVEAVLDAPAA
jgi:polyisoprenoid-binding protein YceI